MMADNSNPPARIGFAISVLKDELRCFPAGPKLNRVGCASVMVPGEHDDFEAITEAIKQCLRRLNRSAIMKQVANDNQLARLIFGQQFLEPMLDRSHAPQRNEPACRALAQFIAKV